MPIVSHPANKNYRDNFDATFGKKDEVVGPKIDPRSIVCPLDRQPCQGQGTDDECDECTGRGAPGYREGT